MEYGVFDSQMNTLQSSHTALTILVGCSKASHFYSAMLGPVYSLSKVSAFAHFRSDGFSTIFYESKKKI